MESKLETDIAGNKFWKNEKGELHNLYNPAVECVDGSKMWYIDGKLSRLAGPASKWADGSKFWLIDGKLDRLDGPAVEWSDGYKEWWIKGVEYSEEEYLNIISKL